MNEEQKSTKDRIVSAAGTLFAKSGYDGTSIRDIAEEAKVNVAAINYHFGGKGALYWEVFSQSRNFLCAEIEKVYSEELSAKELAFKIWQIMVEHSDFMRNTFKLLLSDQLPDAEEAKKALCTQDNIGPPGGELLLRAIERDLKKKTQPEFQFWAVKMIFGQIFHSALIFDTQYFKRVGNLVSPSLLTVEGQRKSIYYHVEAVTEFLKKRN